MMTPVVLAVHMLTAAAADSPAYPNPNLLVEVADLTPGKVHLLDVRGRIVRATFRSGLQGARGLPRIGTAADAYG